MKDKKPEKFSDHFKLQLRRFKQWLKPDPRDPATLRIIKTILKSFVVLLLLLISPVMLIGLFLAFVGLL